MATFLKHKDIVALRAMLRAETVHGKGLFGLQIPVFENPGDTVGDGHDLAFSRHVKHRHFAANPLDLFHDIHDFDPGAHRKGDQPPDGFGFRRR